MTFNQFARAQMPKGAGQHKTKTRCLAPAVSSSRTTVYEGLALVKRLIEMGEKDQAVKLYHQLKRTEQ